MSALLQMIRRVANQRIVFNNKKIGCVKNDTPYFFCLYSIMSNVVVIVTH